MVDPQAPPQTTFHPTDPTSEPAPKRRCTSTRGGYTSTKELPPATPLTHALAGFPPRPTLPPQKTAPSALLAATASPQSYIHMSQGLETADGVNKRHYTTVYDCFNGTQHTSHRLHKSTSSTFLPLTSCLVLLVKRLRL
jgi:hypothetical protein